MKIAAINVIPPAIPSSKRGKAKELDLNIKNSVKNHKQK